jgi:hypothetical protein
MKKNLQGGRIVMSVPVKKDADNGERDIASRYAPPWARDAATDAADAALGAAENLRRVLPAAPQLEDPELRPREPVLFVDPVLRARSSLDPVAVPGPPESSDRSVFSLIARVSAAVGAATLAALFMVAIAPELLRGVEQGTKALGSRMFGTSAIPPAPKPAEHGVARVANQPAAMPEPITATGGIAATTPIAAPPVATPPVVATLPPQDAERAASPAPSLTAPPLRSLEREEIAALYRRGEQMITQGEIAGARLVFTRAAEAGDARSALALGATYDPDVLRKLGVLGVVGDTALAREWYAKASSFGSREAAQRIELMAHGR